MLEKLLGSWANLVAGLCTQYGGGEGALTKNRPSHRRVSPIGYLIGMPLTGVHLTGVYLSYTYLSHRYVSPIGHLIGHLTGMSLRGVIP